MIPELQIPCINTCFSRKKNKGKERAKGFSQLIKFHLKNLFRSPTNSLHLYLISHNLTQVASMSREGGCKYNLLAEPQSHWNKMGDGVGEVSLPEKEIEEGEKGYRVVTCTVCHSGLQLTRYSISLFLNGFIF